jgi:hypothetical protein
MASIKTQFLDTIWQFNRKYEPFQTVPPQSCRRLLMDVVVAQVHMDLNGTIGRLQLVVVVVVADSETAATHST